MFSVAFLLLFFVEYFIRINADCSSLHFCYGHGTCNAATNKCDCFDGFGSDKDVTLYRAADCSARTCPSHRAWSDVPSSSTKAHAVYECSNRGSCDRLTGNCICLEGFTGPACERNKCPNDCSGHGVCYSIRQMAKMSNALPLNANTLYEGDPESTTWDEDMSFGCVCDSRWAVGLGSGETQVPEWFGPDCSRRHCPSADDPQTLDDDTNCELVLAAGGPDSSERRGKPGNLCHVECANRGLCDHSTGLCQCFNGYYGSTCNLKDIKAHYPYWLTV